MKHTNLEFDNYIAQSPEFARPILNIFIIPGAAKRHERRQSST